MKMNEIAARIPLWYASGKSIYLKSAPGRGKTTVLCLASTILSQRLSANIGHVVINGPLLTPADAIGYLVPNKVTGEDGRTHIESHYTDPFWFRTAEGKRLDEYDGGIIIVDEADKMDVDVKKVIGEAALSGRLGPHTLPKGWVVWMAGNRSKDRSGSTKELDHLINRRMEIDVDDDLKAWLDWANAEGVMPLTLAFASQNPQIVFSEGVPDKQGPWCTPRSLVAADEYLRICKAEFGEVPEDVVTKQEIAGMIGDGAAAQLFSFIQLEREMPKFEDICANPAKVPLPEKPDAQMLVAYNLAHRVDDQTVAPVVTYAERLPKEFSVIFAKTAIQRNAKLMNTAAFRSWVSNNASLMAALAR